MARRRPNLGFLGRFGRSEDLRRLDQALRSVDVHPNLIPEAVKLTTVNLLAEEAGGREPPPPAYRAAAEILAYCAIGAESFAGANDVDLALAVERRIDAAVEAGDSLDARLVLLTLHAGIVQPGVVERHGLRSVGA